REGTMAGLLFSALAVATLMRMAVAAGGLPADPGFAPIPQWLPTACWIIAGAGLLFLGARPGTPIRTAVPVEVHGPGIRRARTSPPKAALRSPSSTRCAAG